MSMPKQPQLPRAVAYIRVSKVGTRGEALKSPEYQLHEIQQHATRYGYEIVEVVQDIDKSGRDFRKRRVAEIVGRIKAGEFEKVVVWKWSRWGRNTMENLNWLALLEDAGGQLESATEHFDASTAFGEYARTQVLAMAQLQSRQIGDGWKETQGYRRRAGLPHTSAPRFGYRYRADVKPYPRYEVCEGEAELLRSAYSRFVQGTASFRSISMEWNALGVKTTTGGSWSDASIRVTMDTGFAAGLIRERSKQPREGQPNSRRLVDFDVWRQGGHEAVITPELWAVYRAMREEAAHLAPAARAPKFALSGMLYCAECGQTLKSTTSGPGGRWRQWVCRNGRDRRHQPISISDIQAMRVVSKWLANEATGGDDVTEAAQSILDQRLAAKTETTNLKSDLANAQKIRERLQESWLLGDFERAFYERRKAELDEQIESITDLVAKSAARGGVSEERPTVEMFHELSTQWLEWSPQHQRSTLSRVVRGIVVSRDSEPVFASAWG